MIKLVEHTNGNHIYMKMRLDNGRIEEIDVFLDKNGKEIFKTSADHGMELDPDLTQKLEMKLLKRSTNYINSLRIWSAACPVRFRDADLFQFEYIIFFWELNYNYMNNRKVGLFMKEEARAFCERINAGLTRYMRKNKPAHFTPWISQDGKENLYCCWYYV